MGGTCQPVPSRKPTPPRCDKGADCPSGSCVDHVCSLVPQRSDSGKPCLSDSECLSGKFSGDQCIKKLHASTTLLFGSLRAADPQCSSGKCAFWKSAGLRSRSWRTAIRASMGLSVPRGLARLESAFRQTRRHDLCRWSTASAVRLRLMETSDLSS